MVVASPAHRSTPALGGTKVTLKMWFVFSLWGLGAILFPVLLVYGLVRGRALNVLGAGLLEMVIRRAAGAPPSPLIVSRSDHPRAFWAAMSTYPLAIVALAFLVYAFYFLPHAP